MSTPAVETFQIADVICDLIKDQLSLDDSQVWIYNQKARIPNEPGLFVTVELQAARSFGTSSLCGNDDAGNFCEFQSVNMQEIYVVKLFSRDESALQRAPEVQMALSGVAAQQMCEQYCFRLGPLSVNVVDTSAVEASARLFRQDITFNALRHYNKTRVIDYYDRFSIPPSIHTNQ